MSSLLVAIQRTLVMGLALMKQVSLPVFWVESTYLINFK